MFNVKKHPVFAECMRVKDEVADILESSLRDIREVVFEYPYDSDKEVYQVGALKTDGEDIVVAYVETKPKSPHVVDAMTKGIPIALEFGTSDIVIDYMYNYDYCGTPMETIQKYYDKNPQRVETIKEILHTKSKKKAHRE